MWLTFYFIGQFWVRLCYSYNSQILVTHNYKSLILTHASCLLQLDCNLCSKSPHFRIQVDGTATISKSFSQWDRGKGNSRGLEQIMKCFSLEVTHFTPLVLIHLSAKVAWSNTAVRSGTTALLCPEGRKPKPYNK